MVHDSGCYADADKQRHLRECDACRVLEVVPGVSPHGRFRLFVAMRQMRARRAFEGDSAITRHQEGMPSLRAEGENVLSPQTGNAGRRIEAHPPR